MNSHPFDDAIALVPGAPDRFTGHTSAAYANFVGPFGGISTAQILNAVMVHPKRLGDPVSLSVNFCAALADGEFDMLVRPVRTNRSTQHWVVEVCQENATVLTATAVTAVRRETFGASEVHMPGVPKPEDTPVSRRVPPMEWIKRYELRFVTGGMPEALDGVHRDESLTQVWLRDALQRPLDFQSLSAMSDVFFPRLFLRRASFVPVGTVSLTVYFHAQAEQLARTGSGYLLGQSKGQHFQTGFFDHSAQLWNERGDLLVSTHQIVYYRE